MPRGPLTAPRVRRVLRPLLVAGTVVALVAVVVGCGGRSAGDYRSEAEAVCERGTVEIERVLAAGEGDPARVAEEVRGTVNRIASELGEVEPPDDLADEHAELTRVMREAIAVGEQGRRSGGGEPLRRRYEELTSRGDTLLVELGLDGCRSAAG